MLLVAYKQAPKRELSSRMVDKRTALSSREAGIAQRWEHSTSHQCGQGSITGLGDMGQLSLLLREVFPRVLRFSPLLENQHFQIPVRSWGPP